MLANTLPLSGLIFLAATIYTSVGHAGASGYIAAMALFGVAPAVMKPTALCLNILVASFATWRLHKAGWITWSALWPFVACSVPLAAIGGAIQLPGAAYKLLVGLVLLFAGLRLLIDPREKTNTPRGPAPRPPLLRALGTGAVIGLLSGLTGTGGGIFLSPVLLFMGWAGARQSAGITSPFILLNSIAGLAGNILSLSVVPVEISAYATAALAGALLGTQLAIHWLSPTALQRLLATVLLIAAVKLMLA
ncbi:MAG: sulfite exporter TauE/SafE family protein [Alphaproteobacteria bacterium]|nr:sulfite exporter TauE/SafE family protein [Alphaproteobacteria bacterium]